MTKLAQTYRRDINGLRAWAVIAVILYHFEIPGFTCGLIGVDVFFVITGFLMTGIVVDGLECGGARGSGFSLLDFYMARVRRILPALIVLCTVLLALGWWVMVPADYKRLGSHVVSSLGFYSNNTFRHEAGYFQPASHDVWLLHTWSLSLEWQFYLLFPLVLVALWARRPGRKPVAYLMAAGLLASLCLSIILTPIKPMGSFYLLPTRAWEMLAGGLVWLMGSKPSLSSCQRRSLEVCGFALLLGAILGLDASSQWPGWRALLPVMGTAIILAAARKSSVWTSHPVAQWLGTRSYSLYLWHWPVVVGLVYLERQREPWAIVTGLAVTLVLGQLSYGLVEMPARARLPQLHLRAKAATWLAFALAFAVALPGWLVQRNDGVKGRFSSLIETAAAESANKNPRQATCFISKGVESPSCRYGEGRLRAILIGDSHADSVTTAVADAVPRGGGGIMAWTYAGCPTLFGAKPALPFIGQEYQCAEFLQWVVQKLKEIPRDIPLVIVNRTALYGAGFNEPWEKFHVPLVYFTQLHRTPDLAFLREFADRLTDTACQLAKNHPVYLMRPVPEMGVDVPKAISRAMALGHARYVFVSLADYHKRQQFVWAAQDAARDRCGVQILDPLPYLCPDGRCHGDRNGRPLYYDDDHLSEFGNRFLVPMFERVFADPSYSQGRERAGIEALK